MTHCHMHHAIKSADQQGLTVVCATTYSISVSVCSMTLAPFLRHLFQHARLGTDTFHRQRSLTYFARPQVLRTCQPTLLPSPQAFVSSLSATGSVGRRGVAPLAFSTAEPRSPVSGNDQQLEWDEAEPEPEQVLVLPPPSHSRIKTSDFVKSSTAVSQCPPAKHPEFAVIGRSNVGKSSLINMLTGKKALAQISKTPGNLF